MVTVQQEAHMTIHERIRQIFLQPRAGYSISEAAELLAYSHEEIVAAVGEGDLAIEQFGDIPRVPWEEVALAAVERWSQEVIETALEGDIESVMPELVRLTELRVRVPRFSVVVLGQVAQREGTTINEIMARQLLDLAVVEAETLDRSVSGLSAALRWPLP